MSKTERHAKARWSRKWKRDNNVEVLGVVTTHAIDPNRILRSALERGLTEVVVVGVTKDGVEYFASSEAGGGDTLWHLERARHKLIAMADD